MHRRAECRYSEIGDLQILELPYGDVSPAMVILLPIKIDGLSNLEAKLTYENLNRWSCKLSMGEVRVYFPRFKSTSEFRLGDTLKTMGMTTAFNPITADFSGMTGNRELYISAVIHKAFVDVDEKGTEAAAATGILMKRASSQPLTPPVFRADHPFVFMIRDNRNGSIMFMGRVMNPLQ
jgi:serpin B